MSALARVLFIIVSSLWIKCRSGRRRRRASIRYEATSLPRCLQVLSRESNNRLQCTTELRMQRILILAFLYSSLSLLCRSTRGAPLAVPLYLVPPISRIPSARFISSRMQRRPLCRRGTLVSHHFPDKSALYSFILLHGDGFLAPGTRIRTKPGGCSLLDRRNDSRMDSRATPPARPRVSRILFSRDRRIHRHSECLSECV